MPELHIFDQEGTFARVDNDLDLFKELLLIFFSDYAEKVCLLRKACAAREGMQIERFAHAIKSGLGNVGAMRAHTLAMKLEHAGKANTFDTIDVDMRAFETAVEEFRDAVRKFTE